MEPRLDLFERRFIFRVARALPMFLAGLSTALLALGIFVFLASTVPPPAAREPLPAAEQPMVTLSEADVTRYLALKAMPANAAPPRPAASTAEMSSRSTMASSEAHELALKMYSVARLIQQQGLPWTDRNETVCVSRIFGECYRTERRLAQRGLGSGVVELLELHNTGSLTEEVTIQTAGEIFLVNPSNHQQKIAILEELTVLLTAQSSQPPSDLATAWLELREDRERARFATIQSERDRVSRERLAEQRRFADEQAEKAERRRTALLGVASAIGLLFVAGMLLAVLAIERNTRELKNIASGAKYAAETEPALPSLTPGM